MPVKSTAGSVVAVFQSWASRIATPRSPRPPMRRRVKHIVPLYSRGPAGTGLASERLGRFPLVFDAWLRTHQHRANSLDVDLCRLRLFQVRALRNTGCLLP